MKYLDWKADAKDRWIVDVEGDGLHPTTLWCSVARNLGTDEVLTFTPDDMVPGGKFVDFISSVPIIIGHNFLSYDRRHINRLLGGGIPLDKVVDSLVLSYLYHPHLPDGHSLEAYGNRFGVQKIGHDDWSRYSTEMLERCKRDVDINVLTYKALCERMSKIGFSEKSCLLEHEIRDVIDRQQERGFYFDRDTAGVLVDRLRADLSSLEQPIRELFPPILVQTGEYKFRTKADGTPYASYERHLRDHAAVRHEEDSASYSVWDYQDFDIASPQQRIKKLLSLGWEPEELTPAGNPKVNEDNLKKFADSSGIPEITAIADWVVRNSRLSTITSWLNFCGEDSRIHGTVFTCGAASRRMRHTQPNTANIPSEANEAWWGKELRSLWAATPGRILMGYDASGLEMRGFCHVLWPMASEADRKFLLDQYILGKPHQKNSEALTEALGFPVVYGGGGAKTCVPLSTKALTRRGWKLPGELIVGEEVLGYNQETGLKEWTTLRAVNYLEDEVIEFGNSVRSFQATAGHRWFIRQRTRSESGKSFRRPYYREEVRTTEELNSESNVILNAPFNQEQDTSSRISGLDGKYDIDWVQRVLLMSHAERVQFLQGFMLADGHVDKYGRWHWVQNVNNLSEGALVASYLVNDGQIHVSHKDGSNGTPMISVGLSAKGHMTCQTMEKRSLGRMSVWCPTTDLGSWVMRQGDNITITGNCFYAYLYGAGDKKLGAVLGKSPKVGAQVRATLMASVPGLKDAVEAVQYEWNKSGGLIKTVDGGFVRCPGEHAALNYSIQSAGGIVMKEAAVIFDRMIKERGLDVWLVGSIHDEYQTDCPDEATAKEAGRLGCEAITNAGESLGFNVPLAGEFKIGRNWHETH